MDTLDSQWLYIAGLVIALMAAGSFLASIVGGAVRYVLFVGLAAAIYRMQAEKDGYGFIFDDGVIQQLAIIGGASMLLTWGLIMGFFRKSRFRSALLPVIGFGMTFAIASVFTAS